MMTGSHARGGILVTGGAGFIGSHVVNSLLTRRRDVHVLDNLTSGSLSNITGDAVLHTGDIRSEVDVVSSIRAAEADVIVHCAAQTSVERSMKDWEFDEAVNVSGTQVLLNAARSEFVRRFIFLSSGGAIYGETEQPATEQTSPAPRNFYGMHKLSAEEGVRAAGLPFAVIRPSNVYGPGQRSDAEGGVLAIFCDRITANLPIEIHGAGQQVRDFVYVSDLVEAVLLAISHPEDVIWNVSSGEATAIIDAAHMLGEQLGRKPEFVFQERRSGDVDRSVISPALICSTGRWGPPLTLRDGLRRLVSNAATAPA